MPALAATALEALGREARRHHLLSAAEEIELSRRVQRGMQPDSTPKEQRIGRRSRERMINANLGLVLKNAYAFRKRIAGTILEIEDLAQAAIVGLNRAVDLFDSERGYKFSTYGTLWIAQSIRREIEVNRGTIKVSTEAQTVARRWRHRSADQTTLDTFCEEFGYKREKVEAALFHYQRAQCTSLNKVLDNGDGLNLIDLIADEEQPDVDALHYTMLMEKLEAAPETSDAIAALQLAQTANQKEMAGLLGVPKHAVSKRLEDFKAVVREHLINPCDNAPSKPEPMQTTAPTSNGHAHLERLIEDVQSEAEPQAKPKRRGRRTRAEIEASNSVKAAKQPASVTVAIGGLDISGTPASLAAVIRELQHGKVAA